MRSLADPESLRRIIEREWRVPVDGVVLHRSLAAGPWIYALGLSENLRFHLVTKPLWRGEESLTEGWLEKVLTDLREVEDTLGRDGA